MTLDEAIKHCLEVAEQKEHDSAELIDILDELDVDACKQCAADHRQLAEWLTEIQELKNIIKLIYNETVTDHFGNVLVTLEKIDDIVDKTRPLWDD